MSEKEMLLTHINRRLSHAATRVSKYKEDDPNANYSAGESLGYWKGRVAALEDIKDFIENNL
jgi:hypothetical protein